MATNAPDLDLLLVSRYALLVALCHLIPVPIVDALADTFLRRRLTRLQLRAADVELPRKSVSMLGDGSGGGVLGLVWSVVSWPFRKALRYVLWVLLVKGMVDTFSDVVARAVMLHEALALGALPGDPKMVRVAMQRALAQTNTRPLERAVGIVFRSSKGELRRLSRQGRARVRMESTREREDHAADASDEAPLQGELEPLSEALARALWVPEVHDKLRAHVREQIHELDLAPAPSEPDPSDANEAPAADRTDTDIVEDDTADDPPSPSPASQESKDGQADR